jgi:hypothetical protein
MASGRTFDGIDDVISLAVGNCGPAFGPATVAIILKRGGTNSENIIGGFNGAGQAAVTWELGIDDAGGGNVLYLDFPSVNFSVAPTITVVPGDNFVLLAITKATGSSAVRFHRYKYDTSTWTHENGAAINNSPVTTNRLQLGAADTDFYTGDILIAGYWTSVLSDLVIETLKDSLTDWENANPQGLWLLNQTSIATPVPDLTGGGADQSAITGTSVSANDLPQFVIEEFIMKGTATLDFGAFPGKSDASVVVTGQADIVSGSLVEAWIRLEATSDHTADEHLLETLKVSAGNIVAGTGFTIYGINTSQLSGPNDNGTRIYGQWTVAWAWA